MRKKTDDPHDPKRTRSDSASPSAAQLSQLEFQFSAILSPSSTQLSHGCCDGEAENGGDMSHPGRTMAVVVVRPSIDLAAFAGVVMCKKLSVLPFNFNVASKLGSLS
eukprot:scaffold13753_cov65-Cyclotella_meneghiniana.AAC.4